MPVPQVSPIQVFARVGVETGLLGEQYHRKRSLAPLVEALGGVRGDRMEVAHRIFAARLPKYRPDQLLKALQERKTLVRAWGPRGALQIVPTLDLRLYLAAAASTAGRWKKFLDARSNLTTPARLRLLRRICPEVVTRDALREAFPKGEIRERVGPYALFYLPAAAPRMPDGVRPSSAVIGGKIALDGWSTRLTGGAVEVTLVWRPLEPLPTGYTAFVHLLDGRGEIIGQQDRPPAGYPTVDWRTGEIISDRFTISRPANLPADWALRTGFYDPVTLQPLGEPVILHQP